MTFKTTEKEQAFITAMTFDVIKSMPIDTEEQLRADIEGWVSYNMRIVEENNVRIKKDEENPMIELLKSVPSQYLGSVIDIGEDGSVKTLEPNIQVKINEKCLEEKKALAQLHWSIATQAKINTWTALDDWQKISKELLKLYKEVDEEKEWREKVVSDIIQSSVLQYVCRKLADYGYFKWRNDDGMKLYHSYKK